MSKVQLPQLSPELEKLISDSIAEFGQIVRRLCTASVAFGAETSKEAILASLQEVLTAKKDLLSGETGLPKAKDDAHGDSVIPLGEYGAVAQLVRVALDHFRYRSGGVSVPIMHRYIVRDLHATDVKEAQIRNTLKGLIKSGHAVTVIRGMYKAGPKLPKSKEAA